MDSHDENHREVEVPNINMHSRIHCLDEVFKESAVHVNPAV